MNAISKFRELTVEEIDFVAGGDNEGELSDDTIVVTGGSVNSLNGTTHYGSAGASSAGFGTLSPQQLVQLFQEDMDNDGIPDFLDSSDDTIVVTANVTHAQIALAVANAQAYATALLDLGVIGAGVATYSAPGAGVAVGTGTALAANHYQDIVNAYFDSFIQNGGEPHVQNYYAPF